VLQPGESKGTRTRAPAASLVDEQNGGWQLVTNQLNHARVALFLPSRFS